MHTLPLNRALLVHMRSVLWSSPLLRPSSSLEQAGLTFRGCLQRGAMPCLSSLSTSELTPSGRKEREVWLVDVVAAHEKTSHLIKTNCPRSIYRICILFFFFSIMLTNAILHPLPRLSLSFSDGGGTLEVAVMGTVVPVNLHVEPGTTLDFGECPAGSTNTQQIQVGSA